jgi:hypothetical protein
MDDRVIRADRDDWSRFWSEVWRERRAEGVARRAERVADRLEDPPELPGWLSGLLEECGSEFTPRQVEALVYRHGYGLSLQEAANALGVKKPTFRKRLAGAQRKADHLTGTYAGWADRLRREVADLGLTVDGLDPDRMADYVIPLTDRQRLWERVADRQWA